MPVLLYTLLRLLLVVVAGGFLYLLGLRGLWLPLGAVVIGALLSYLLLRGPREEAARTLQRVAERSPAPAAGDADSEAEDALVDDEVRPDDVTPDAASADAARPHAVSLDVANRDDVPRSGGSEREDEEQQHPEHELQEPGVAQDGDELPGSGGLTDPPRQ